MGDPIHQFQLKSLFSLGHIGPYEIAFTNSALFMLIALLATAALMLIPTRQRALVPSRAQSGPRFPTNSSPTPSRAPPARKA